MKQIEIKQVFRVKSSIKITISDADLQSYLDGDFETPTSDDPRWQRHWDLQNEEVIQLPNSELKPGEPGFQWAECAQCGSRSLRCGCD